MSDSAPKPSRWQRFKRIPSLKRLLIFSTAVMVGGVATLVAGSAYVQMLAPGSGLASSWKKGTPGIFGPITPPAGAQVFSEGMTRCNILLLGIDYNHDSKGIIYTKGARSDTMMLVSTSNEAKFLNALSVPRDTYVPIGSSGGYDKINSAYSYGGVKETEQTISRFLGVPINHYVIVKVYGAKKVIDALGGLTLNVEKDMDYDDNWGGLHIHLKKGMQTLNGEQTVGYARFRKDEEGDYGRMRRQQQVIRAVLKALKDPGTITKIPALAAAVKETLETDLTTAQLVDLARLYQGFDHSKMRSAQTVGSDDIVNEAMVIVPNEAENQKLVRRLMKDEGDLTIKDMRIRILNGTNDANLGSQVADEMNLRGYNIVKVDDSPRRDVKTTEVTEHIRNPRAHTRLQQFFPGAAFRDSASPNPDYDVTITLGSDSALLTQHFQQPSSTTVQSASRWEAPPASSYPTYRETERAPQAREPEPSRQAARPEPEPSVEPPAPEVPTAREPEPAAPEPAAPAPEPAIAAPPPTAAPAPAPEPPAPEPQPVSPPPAPAATPI